MIIKLCESIIKALEKKDPNAEHFLDDLISARRNGYIALDISKKEILRVKSVSNLNPRQLAILDYEKEMLTYYKNDIRKMSYRTNFCHSAFCEEKHDNPPNDIQNYSSEIYEKNHSGLGKAAIVLENINDAKIYNRIIEWAMRNSNLLKSFHYSYDVLHGGGDTTSEVCRDTMKYRFDVFAICDSDKKSPYGNIGRTARKVLDVYNQANKKFNLLCIEAQEVENLIPIDLHVSVALETQKEALNFIKEAITVEPSSYLYYDLKNSFKISFLINKESHCSMYWAGIVEKTTATKKVTSFSRGEKTDDFTLTNKLSSLLPHSLSMMEKYTTLIPHPEILKDEWSKISNFLIPRVLASKPYKF